MTQSSYASQNRLHTESKNQLTLTDIFKVSNNQIHSKKIFSKFNHLRSATSNYEQIQKELQMFKIKQNLARLSYTIKTIQSKDDQIGIKSKRVPLKSKHNQLQQIVQKQRDSRSASQISYKSIDKYTIPANQFISKPFVIVKKQKHSRQRSSSQLQVNSSKGNQNNFQIVNPQPLAQHCDYQNVWTLRKNRSQSSTKFKLMKQLRKKSQSKRKQNKKQSSEQILADIPNLKTSQNIKISFSKYLQNFNKGQSNHQNGKQGNKQITKRISNLQKGRSGQLLKKIQNWEHKQNQQNQQKAKDTPFRRYNTKKVYQSWIQNRYVKEKYRFWKQSRESNKQNY